MMRGTRGLERATVALLALVSCLPGCEAAAPGSGLGALLRVEGAQWQPGPTPAEAGGQKIDHQGQRQEQEDEDVGIEKQPGPRLTRGAHHAARIANL